MHGRRKRGGREEEARGKGGEGRGKGVPSMFTHHVEYEEGAGKDVQGMAHVNDHFIEGKEPVLIPDAPIEAHHRRYHHTE